MQELHVLIFLLLRNQATIIIFVLSDNRSDKDHSTYYAQ